MNAKNLLLVALAGFGAWWLMSKKSGIKALPWTPGMTSQFPGITNMPAVGSPTCPPGYYLNNGMCIPVPAQQTGQAAPVVVKASEDMVWSDGQLVPVSQIFG
jgi:hypothetical protein